MNKNDSNQELNLDRLRREIRDTDTEILRLAARRMNLCREVGAFKKKNHLPVKDFKVEKVIIEKGRQQAKKHGIFPELAESLLKTLINFSVEAQDQLIRSREKDTEAAAQKILVIGGGGLMGTWFCQFFDSLGYLVTIVDRQKPQNCGYPFHSALTEKALEADFIVVATPLSQTAEIMNELISKKPKGIVIDICSLKTPLLEVLERAKKEGVRTVSIHPMFGPEVEMLSGRNIILCEDNNEDDLRIVESIFRETSAKIIILPLASHDPLMSYILGSAHLVNLLFASVMAKSKMSFSTLKEVAGTTFQNQIAVTRNVVNENQDLYYEIQHHNSYTKALFDSMESAMKTYKDALASSDRNTFKAEMAAAKQYFRQDTTE